MLDIETEERRYLPLRFIRRVDGLPVLALRVWDVTLRDVMRWCGGHTWARSLVVPVDGGEFVATEGDWVVSDGERFLVLTDEAFRAAFEAVAS